MRIVRLSRARDNDFAARSASNEDREVPAALPIVDIVEETVRTSQKPRINK
jgi:hypothetical protein